MDTALRPMSTSQVLDRTFHLYRNHFALLAGIGILLPALLLVLQLIFIPLGFPPRAGKFARPEDIFNLAFFGYLLSVSLVSLIGYALSGGATVYAVSRTHLSQNVTIGESYRKVFTRFWALVRIALCIYGMLIAAAIVLEIAVIVVVFIFVGLGAASSNSSLKIIGFVAAAVVGVVVVLGGFLGILCLYAKFSLAVPASMLEGHGAFSALRRSNVLAKGSIFRIILIYLLMGILGVVLSLVFTLPGQVLAMATGGKYFLLSTLLQYFGGFVAGVLVGPVSTIAIALVYYDQRVRKEAFDLQLMMEAVGQPAQPQVVTAPPSIG